MISGCGADLLVNICLTLLGYFPGHIHAFYLEYVYFDRREKGRTPYKRIVQALLIRFVQAASDNCLLILLRVCTRITFSPAARGVMGLFKRKVVVRKLLDECSGEAASPLEILLEQQRNVLRLSLETIFILHLLY
jgi:Proteolipid membrane potential modulator